MVTAIVGTQQIEGGFGIQIATNGFCLPSEGKQDYT